MCNLYRMTKAPDEVARLFAATVGPIGNAGGEVYPGYPGLVVAAGELRSMTWGFPLKLKGARPGSKPKPVNNARADRLDSFLWRYAFRERRCLIPVTEFAEAEGERGAKTRTWFRLPDQEVFAVAGIWRDTPEWGPAYSMVMTEACVHVADVHDRMPVILRREDWADWLDGPPDDARVALPPLPRADGQGADIRPLGETLDGLTLVPASFHSKRMGWGSPSCISHLIRDGLALRLACECGRVAVPDLKALRQVTWRRCRGEDLADLARVLECADCGSRRFTIDQIAAPS